MADKIVLKINDVALELTNDDYKEDFSNVDSVNVSEAGTNLRAVIRTGILGMSISYKCDAAEKARLDAYSKLSSVVVKKWDEETGSEIAWNCFITNYSTSLIMETPTTRFYKVSFKLKDLEA